MTTPDQPGWYDDPQDPNAQRYWDGQDWTPHRQRKMTSRSARQSATSAPQQPAAPPNLPPSPSGATPQDQLPRAAQRQRFWSGLSGRQKIIVVAVIVVMAVIIVPVFAFSHGAHRSPSPAGPSRSRQVSRRPSLASPRLRLARLALTAAPRSTNWAIRVALPVGHAATTLRTITPTPAPPSLRWNATPVARAGSTIPTFPRRPSWIRASVEVSLRKIKTAI